MRVKTHERAKQIKVLREQGLTYREIGEMFGVTKQCIQLICFKFGIEKPKKEVVFVSPQEKYQKRIKENVKVSDTGCWEWQKAKSPQGYGRISYKGKPDYTHRVAYRVFVGEIDDNLCVLHECDNPACVNPEHLWAGTHLENNQDRKNKGRNGASGRKKKTSTFVL